MPAARARARPPASARFDTTTATVASRRPVAVASMIDWRFDPRPEMSTPSLRVEGDRDDIFAAYT
jgi:hypothetical protein